MDLLNLFREYGDKQEILAKLREDQSLRGYNSSELHILAAIGDLEQPNVTSLAEYMGMTRGGICKNVKKLTDAGLISSYQKDGNAKNIYYRLTDTGKVIYEKHAEAHKAWLARDMAFIKGFSDEQLSQIADFMNQYIKHIDECIKESENNGESR
ncbi:MAG: MarR family transcriptional regulator [Clostridium sp.]|nr:MarR family transcriptional regulator [Clostridium sp.]MCM1499304.1 MarR family transcriptional regulator [Clostridium sp.]